MPVVTGDREYFKGVGPIPFEGLESDNPLAFRFYEPDRRLRGQRMEDLFRFAVAYWHSFCGTGADPFGAPTRDVPWTGAADPLDEARMKMDAAFEFITKLGVRFYCFHDFDLVREGATPAESERRLAAVIEMAKEKQAAAGVRPLWGTANLFSHPRYMNGAATNPDFAVVARAGAQVKMAIDATLALGGEHYVFWGGREGYLSLLNTDMKREQAHLAEFLRMARDYARAQGLKGNLLIEPKPMEPTKHQYDYDASTVIGFLRAHGLDDDFKLNIEVNHSTLAGHAFEHELQVAADAGMLGSIDANRGDVQNGWDTDQFPADLFEVTQAMMIILEAGGFAGGGINFDAKLRRNSTDPEDLFYAHISSMDLFARAALAADALLETSPIRRMRSERYAGFDGGRGAEFEAGRLQLADLHALAATRGEPDTISGRQELYEAMLNRYL